MPRHKLTPDDRRRGQAKGVETKRARREAPLMFEPPAPIYLTNRPLGSTEFH
jgi:hypothetical protein